MADVVSEVAGALFRSGCLKFGSFRVKSGALSPYNIDLSCLLSSPKDFRCVANAVADEIKKTKGLDRIDKLASIELKGALLLPSIASRLNLPSVAVRKVDRKYGVTGRIAGGAVARGRASCFLMMLLLMECPRLRD